MKYQPPVGATDPDAPYVNRNLASGTQGSRVPAEAIEDTQREIVNAIIQSGQTPDEADMLQLWKAIQRSLSTEKAIQNVKQFQTTARTSMSQTGANVLVTPWSGLSYTKKSATSLLMVLGSFQTFTPSGTANGATRARVTVGASTIDTGTLNGITQSATGAAPSISLVNTPILFLNGVEAGAAACSLSFFRTDASAWTTIFNPRSTDTADYPATNTATLIFAEIEP